MNNPNRSKMVIIMRKDLKMNKGKLMAQASHAVLGCFLSHSAGDIDCYEEKEPVKDKLYELVTIIKSGSAIQDWLRNAFTKVVLAVNSEKELLSYEKAAKEANLPCQLITDAGYTCFNGVPTNTCLAIGPAWNEEIDAICSSLKLY